MKKIILGFYLFLSISVYYSQDYVGYNKKIIEAQNLILDNKIDSSLFLYQEAFKIVSKPFPKDLLNAGLVAWYLDSIVIMEKFIVQYVEVGGYYKFIKRKLKRKYRNYKFWKKVKDISNNYVVEMKQDSIFIIINEMLQLDQAARKFFFNKKNKILKVDSLNSIKLHSMLSEKFYPGFLTIGVYKSVIITNWLLLHFPIRNYETIIVNAMKKGEITPYMAGFIYTRQYKFHNKNACPTTLPKLINSSLRIYKGERYKILLKKGYDFNYHL